jgi:hypothetical protein
VTERCAFTETSPHFVCAEEAVLEVVIDNPEQAEGGTVWLCVTHAVRAQAAGVARKP